MSNPKHRNPIPENKPDAYILSSKVAKENPELVEQFDKLADRMYGVDFAYSEHLPKDVLAVVKGEKNSVVIKKKTPWYKRIFRRKK